MCDPPQKIENPAGKLADLLQKHFGVTVFSNNVISMIKQDWTKLKVLAHAVHDEQEQREATLLAERKARAVADDYKRY